MVEIAMVVVHARRRNVELEGRKKGGNEEGDWQRSRSEASLGIGTFPPPPHRVPLQLARELFLLFLLFFILHNELYKLNVDEKKDSTAAMT